MEGNLETPNIDSFAKMEYPFQDFMLSSLCSDKTETLIGKYFVRTGVNGVTRGYERMNTNEKNFQLFKEKLFYLLENGDNGFNHYIRNSRDLTNFMGYIGSMG